MARPKIKDVQIHIKLTSKQKEEIRKKATEKGQTITEFIVKNVLK
jgi:uncharacterized protein (DUF1778 family)